MLTIEGIFAHVAVGLPAAAAVAVLVRLALPVPQERPAQPARWDFLDFLARQVQPEPQARRELQALLAARLARLVRQAQREQLARLALRVLQEQLARRGRMD